MKIVVKEGLIMNKKIKWLSIVPLYGTCILLIYLFVLSIKHKISKGKFIMVFWISAFVSSMLFYLIVILAYIFSKKIIQFDFNKYGAIVAIIIGGYLMNAFTFIYVDKKWNYLTFTDTEKRKSFLEENMGKIMLYGFIAAIILIIIFFVTIIALKYTQ